MCPCLHFGFGVWLHPILDYTVLYYAEEEFLLYRTLQWRFGEVANWLFFTIAFGSRRQRGDSAESGDTNVSLRHWVFQSEVLCKPSGDEEEQKTLASGFNNLNRLCWQYIGTSGIPWESMQSCKVAYINHAFHLKTNFWGFHPLMGQNPDTQTSIKMMDEPADIWYLVQKDKICFQMLKSEAGEQAGARGGAIRDIHNLLLGVLVNHFLQPFFYVHWETFTSFMFASRDKSHLQLKAPLRTTSLDLFFI